MFKVELFDYEIAVAYVYVSKCFVNCKQTQNSIAWSRRCAYGSPKVHLRCVSVKLEFGVLQVICKLTKARAYDYTELCDLFFFSHQFNSIGMCPTIWDLGAFFWNYRKIVYFGLLFVPNGSEFSAIINRYNHSITMTENECHFIEKFFMLKAAVVR